MPEKTYLITQAQLQAVLNIVSRLSSPSIPMGDVVGMVDMLRQLPEYVKPVEPKEETPAKE